MAFLEVLTPSYRPDLELCEDLCRSVMLFGGPEVRHRLLVPRRDRELFARFANDRTRVELAADHLPRSFVPVPHNFRVDLRRPWWPVRGWVTQQIVKLEATARSEADVVVLADSDLVFARPFGLDTFRGPDGRLAFYRLPGGVDEGMPRYPIWHDVSRWLLGLPPVGRGDALDDYICWPCTWSPQTVRDMLARIESVHGRSWQRLVGAQRHFSEMILYGVYVMEVLREAAPFVTVSEMACTRHTEETTLGPADLRALVSSRRPDDVAIMISAKSNTDIGMRRDALADVLPL
jgi:hypothetical protein